MTVVVGVLLGMLWLAAFAGGWWCGADHVRDRTWGLLFDRGLDADDETWRVLRSVRHDLFPASWLGITWGGKWTT